MRRKKFHLNKEKKGLSPVVATVLLISIVVAIAVIVFLWFQDFTQEAVTKFDGKNIELVCDDVDFQADYSGGVLDISNSASKNVPIYDMRLKIFNKGSENTKKLSRISDDWPDYGIGPGGVYSERIEGSLSDAESLKLVPILLGNSESGTKVHVCEEKDGVEVNNL